MRRVKEAFVFCVVLSPVIAIVADGVTFVGFSGFCATKIEEYAFNPQLRILLTSDSLVGDPMPRQQPEGRPLGILDVWHIRSAVQSS